MRPRGAKEEGNPHFSGKYACSFFFFFLRVYRLGPWLAPKPPQRLSLRMFKMTLRPPGYEDLDDRHALSKLELTLEHTPASCQHPRHLASISRVTNLLSQQDFLLQTSSHCRHRPEQIQQQPAASLGENGFERRFHTFSIERLDQTRGFGSVLSAAQFPFHKGPPALGDKAIYKPCAGTVYKEGVPLVVNILLEKLKTVKIKSHVARLAKCLYSGE